MAKMLAAFKSLPAVVAAALAALAAHAEDVALLLGCLLFSSGAGLAFGPAFGLMAAGALLVAYGIWITPGRRV